MFIIIIFIIIIIIIIIPLRSKVKGLQTLSVCVCICTTFLAYISVFMRQIIMNFVDVFEVKFNGLCKNII